MSFNKKKILITGASKGLGKEIAKEFEKVGSKLCLIARTNDLLKDLHKKFKKKKDHLIIPEDLLALNKLDDLMKIIKNEFGEIDIIIHCLGGSFGINNPLDNWKNFEKSLRGNLGIAIDINKFFLPGMIKRKSGNIIHISSIASQQISASPFYCTSKAALNGYIRGMGNYLANYGVFLSGIIPGAFIGDKNAMDRFKYFKKKEYKKFVKNLPQGEMPHAKEYLGLIKMLSSKNDARIFAGSLINVDSGQGISIL